MAPAAAGDIDPSQLEELRRYFPNKTKDLRACLRCRMIMTKDQFLLYGCPTCSDVLVMQGDDRRVMDCTTANFQGFISLIRPGAFLSRFSGLENRQLGCYALTVQGTIPAYILHESDMEGDTQPGRVSPRPRRGGGSDDEDPEYQKSDGEDEAAMPAGKQRVDDATPRTEGSIVLAEVTPRTEHSLRLAEVTPLGNADNPEATPRSLRLAEATPTDATPLNRGAAAAPASPLPGQEERRTGGAASFSCVAPTVLSHDLSAALTAVRRLEVGEVVEAIEGPALDEATGVQRVRCKAVSDGTVGWVTIATNEGTLFLEPSA